MSSNSRYSGLYGCLIGGACVTVATVLVLGVFIASTGNEASSSSVSATDVSPAPTLGVRGIAKGLGAAPECRSGLASFDRASQIHLKTGSNGSVEVYGSKEAQRVSEANIIKFRKAAFLIAALSREADAPTDEKLMDDPSFGKRLDSAVQLVTRSAEPPCAWRWSEVQSIVRRYGWRLIVEGYGLVNPFVSDQEDVASGSSLSFQGHL